MSAHLTGSCLCGAVRYEITGPFLRANHCHCTRCRRHSGSYGLTQGRVLREHFTLSQGAELLANYRLDRHAAKVFCSACGSSVFGGSWPDGKEVSIRFGTLDDDPGIRPQFHTFVGDKAPWDVILDDLPQFAGRATRDDMVRLGMSTP